MAARRNRRRLNQWAQKEEAVRRQKVGRPMAWPLQDQQLVLEEQILGEKGPNPTWFQEPGQSEN
jgi:hypothetical protein